MINLKQEIGKFVASLCASILLDCLTNWTQMEENKLLKCRQESTIAPKESKEPN